MPYCKRCGTFMPEGARVCSGCGYRAAPERTENGKRERTGQQTGEYHQEQNGQYEGSYSEQEASGASDASRRTWDAAYENNMYRDGMENKGLCILCYFGLLFLIPYFLRPNSKFVRYHCNQGLLLLIADAVVSCLSRFGRIGSVLGAVGGVFIVVCMIQGIINAVSGRCEPLPYIGRFTIISSF